MSAGVRFVCPVIAALAAACAGGDPSDVHDHGADGGDLHHVRDPATEPCDRTNWFELLPDLRECDLAGALLDGANLRRVDLSDAILTGARMHGVDLFTAALVRATASDAVLDAASLTAADLSDVDLTGASLLGADLTQVDLTGATVDRAATDPTTTCPDGEPGPCW